MPDPGKLTARVFTTPSLREANRIAVEQDLNRALHDEFVDSLDPQGTHVVSFTLLHNDTEIRAEVMCKVNDDPLPHTAWIDVPLDLWDDLTQSVDYELTLNEADDEDPLVS